MRSLKRWRVLPLVLAMVTAMVSGLAYAGEVQPPDPGSDFFDGMVVLDPDAKNPDASGEVTALGALYRTTVEVVCVDADNNFALSCQTNHPDKVKVKKAGASVEQAQKGNLTDVEISGTVGGRVLIDPAVCTCEKAEQTGEAKTKKSGKMGLTCDLKQCVCADLTADETASALSCFDAKLTKTVKGKLKDGKFDLKIKAKGAIAIDPLF